MNGKISLFVLATLVTVTVLGSTTATMAQMMPNATNATMEATNATMGEMANATNATMAVGNVEQLTDALGNNSEILANNTPIGNPNASMAEKLSNALSTNQTNS